MAHVRHFAGFVAIEVSLVVVTALIFTTPSIMSAMSALGLGVAAWYVLTWPFIEIFYPKWIKDLTPLRRHVVIVGFSCFAGMLFWIIGSQTLEDHLYASGNFGEPPENRYLAYRQYESSGKFYLVLEFGVRKFQIEHPFFQARVGAIYDKKQIFVWADDSGKIPEYYSDVIPKLRGIVPSDNPDKAESIFHESGSYPDLLAIELPRLTVQPNRALYFLMISDQPFELINCLFKPWGVDDKECPDEVELIHATSSNYY